MREKRLLFFITKYDFFSFLFFFTFILFFLYSANEYHTRWEANTPRNMIYLFFFFTFAFCDHLTILLHNICWTRIFFFSSVSPSVSAYLSIQIFRHVFCPSTIHLITITTTTVITNIKPAPQQLVQPRPLIILPLPLPLIIILYIQNNKKRSSVAFFFFLL